MSAAESNQIGLGRSEWSEDLLQTMYEWELPVEGRAVYQCRILICPEEDGGFSAVALKFPGVITQGDTLEETLENARDAFRETIQYYKEIGEPVPFKDVEVDRGPGCFERWIVVNG